MITEQLSKQFIHFFINPFSKKKTVDYKILLKNSKRILLSCPAEEEKIDYGASIDQFSNLFSEKTIVIIYPEEAVKTCKLISHKYKNSPKKIKYNLWYLLCSSVLKQLKRNKYDVFIDLDPNFSILNFLLCRSLMPSLRISFVKPHSKQFYNLCYNYNHTISYSKNRKGLYNFLCSMLDQN